LKNGDEDNIEKIIFNNNELDMEHMPENDDNINLMSDRAEELKLFNPNQ